jgi:purine-binding chemotaxis protein CheW
MARATPPPLRAREDSKSMKDLHIVGFRVGRETFGVPISLVHEIMRVPEITAVPEAPECIEGVINLRGKIVSVVDLRKRFGEREIKNGKKNRVLVAEIAGKMVGLIVDAASEVLKIPASQVEDPPEVFQEGEVHYVTGVAKFKGRLIIMIDLNRILERGELRRLGEFSEPQTHAAQAAAS